MSCSWVKSTERLGRIQTLIEVVIRNSGSDTFLYLILCAWSWELRAFGRVKNVALMWFHQVEPREGVKVEYYNIREQRNIGL